MGRQDAPAPSSPIQVFGTIPGLTQNQLKALMIEIAYAETAYTPTYNANNQLGRYAVGAVVLTEYGYIKPDYLKTMGLAAVTTPNAWTGKDNITSATDFLKAIAIQDIVMGSFLKDMHTKLKSSSPAGIAAGDPTGTAAGMLYVAYSMRNTISTVVTNLTAMRDLAVAWRIHNSGSTFDNQSPVVPYNNGRYAIDILSQGQ